MSGIHPLYLLVIRLAKKHSVDHMRDRDVWEHEIDEHWKLYLVGGKGYGLHGEMMKPGTVYVEWNGGFPAGLLSPYGVEEFVGGEAANLDTFAAALGRSVEEVVP